MKKCNVKPEMLTRTIPQYCEVIGSVTTEKYPIGAVLVRSTLTGMYALVSAGALCSVSQEEAKNYVMEIEA